MDKDMRQLMKRLRKAGYETGTTTKGHPFVVIEGATFYGSGTASDHRSLANFKAQLRRAGVPRDVLR